MQVESSDLITYGLIPEFIGRFPVLVSLAALNEDQLVQVSFPMRNAVQSCLQFSLELVTPSIDVSFTVTIINMNFLAHLLNAIF